MAILFLGSTAKDLGGQCVPNTTTTLGRDPDFTPEGCNINVDADGIGGGFTVAWDKDTIVSNTVWIHYLYGSNNTLTYAGLEDGHWLTISSGSTIIMRVDVADGVYTMVGGGSSSASFIPYGPNVNITYDFKVVCDGVNVTVEAYQNGSLVATLTYASSVDVPDTFTFDNFDTMYSSSARDFNFSEFIVAEGESTLGWRLASLAPNLQGTHTAWLGDNTDVVSFGDGKGISSDAAGEKESWTLTPYGGPATASGVRAVVNKILASQGVSGPTQITPFVRHAATDADGAVFSPNGQYHLDVMDNNPQTGIAWDTADLAALEIGVKSTA